MIIKILFVLIFIGIVVFGIHARDFWAEVTSEIKDSR